MFPKVSNAQVEKIDRIQSAYFSAHKEVFDPPLPKGVPERLERIVSVAEITDRDTVLDVGTGTGILLPLILGYGPARVYANDLSRPMLESVQNKFPNVFILQGDISQLEIHDGSIDVVVINACYPNILDKHTAFLKISRMMRNGGRIVISHPMGRRFIEILKNKMPFPLDDFPADEATARELFGDYGLEVGSLVDERDLYILVLRRRESVLK